MPQVKTPRNTKHNKAKAPTANQIAANIDRKIKELRAVSKALKGQK